MNERTESGFPIFIVGAQRSGTTLLRLMLNAHSAVAIPEEGTFWMPLLKRVWGNPAHRFRGRELERLLDYIENNHQFRLWGSGIEGLRDRLPAEGCTLRDLMDRVYGAYAYAHVKPRWSDKTPGFSRVIPTLASLFPEASFIHIVRDGRDVYVSEKRFRQKGKNAAVAALEWAYKVEKVRRDASRCIRDRYKEIHYETLVRDPEGTLKDLCRFTGLNYEESMLNYWTSSDRYIGAHHSELIFRPVSVKSVGKWKEALSENEARVFELTAGSTLAALNYELSGGKARTAGALAAASLQLLAGLPLRASSILYTNLTLRICSYLGLGTTASGKGISPGAVSTASTES